MRICLCDQWLWSIWSIQIRVHYGLRHLGSKKYPVCEKGDNLGLGTLGIWRSDADITPSNKNRPPDLDWRLWVHSWGGCSRGGKGSTWSDVTYIFTNYPNIQVIDFRVSVTNHLPRHCPRDKSKVTLRYIQVLYYLILLISSKYKIVVSSVVINLCGPNFANTVSYRRIWRSPKCGFPYDERPR